MYDEEIMNKFITLNREKLFHFDLIPHSLIVMVPGQGELFV